MRSDSETSEVKSFLIFLVSKVQYSFLLQAGSLVFSIFPSSNKRMKKWFVIFLGLAVNGVSAQISEAKMRPSLWLDIWDKQDESGLQIRQIGYHDIPRNLPVKGVLVEALEFTDKHGYNLVVCTQTGKFPVSVKNEEGNYEKLNDRAELSFYHFVKAGDSYKMLAELNDEQDCDGFDLYNGFTKKSLALTDLDRDGIAEISFQVTKSCRSDVSPAERKLFLFEAGQPYYLQGFTTLEGMPAGKLYGRMVPGKVFLRNTWKRNGCVLRQMILCSLIKLWKKNE